MPSMLEQETPKAIRGRKSEDSQYNGKKGQTMIYKTFHNMIHIESTFLFHLLEDVMTKNLNKS